MLKFSKTLPVGLQLYSVRDYAEKDFAATMKKVKTISCALLQLSLLHSLSLLFYWYVQNVAPRIHIYSYQESGCYYVHATSFVGG